jgi:hypothetical protein
VQVSSGAAVIAQGAGSREDVNTTFAGGVVQAAGQKFYAAFDVTVTGAGAVAADDYFASFLQSTSNFNAKVFITPANTGGNDFTFGIQATSGDDLTVGANGAKWATDFAFGSTNRIVTAYDFNTTTTELWINPTSESDPHLTIVSTVASTANAAYSFRQAGDLTVTQTVDNLNVATTFQEALTGVAVPEPASLGVLALGGLTLLARRRK